MRGIGGERCRARVQGWCLGVLGLLAVLPGLSCKQIPKAPAPRPRTLRGAELPLVVDHLQTAPKRIFTSEERLEVHFFFDPKVADVRRIRAYGLWLLDPETSAWQRAATASAEPRDGKPLFFEVPEGVHGLRASAVYDDGTEVLVPQPGEEPLVWLHADRTPPSLQWLEPMAERTILRRPFLDLRWSANEQQFGKEPMELEWSGDGGATWKTIARVAPHQGHNHYRWNVPRSLPANALLRVKAVDLSGLESSATVALAYADRPSRRPAEGALEAPGGAEMELEVEEEGLELAAAGREASASPRQEARPGETAGVSGESQPAGPARDLEVDALPEDCIPGGARRRIGWRVLRPEADFEAVLVLESSLDGGATWLHAVEAPLEASGIDWEAPRATMTGHRLRLSLRDAEGKSVVLDETELSIDAEAPRWRLEGVPPLAGGDLRLKLALEDRGCSGPAAVQVYLRGAGEAWSELPREKVRLEEGELALDLRGLAEKSYELFLVASDRAGNRSPAPGAEAAAAPAGSFRLDRTPPSLALEPSLLEWVGGFQAEAQVAFDTADCVPPLIVEGREAGGEWVELGRWQSLAPLQGLLRFVVPPRAPNEGGRERLFELRVTVSDAAGNRAAALLGPRRVESPIALASFRETRSYAPAVRERIDWLLHPVAREVEDELRVTVSHQARPGAAWNVLYENRPAASRCYWELPAGGGEEHRLRVELFRDGVRVGEDISAPFGISAAPVELPGLPGRIALESNVYLERARAQAASYHEALEGARPVPASALALAQSARENYLKALSLDGKSHQAAYGLAQLLNRMDPEGNAGEALRWLERTVEILPEHAWALNDLGAAYIRRGDHAKAEAVLGRSLAVRDSAIGRFNLGLALFYQGKSAAARQELLRALAAGEGVPAGDVHFYTVFTHLQEGDLEGARALYDEHRDVIAPELLAEIEKRL